MSIKQLIIFLISLTFISLITGCGEDPEKDLPTGSIKGVAGNSSYIINNATTYQDKAEVGGIIFQANTAGGLESIAGFAIERNASESITIPKIGYSTTNELRKIIALIGTEGYLNNLSTINEQVFTKYSEFTVGDYSFTMPTSTTTVDIRNQILKTLSESSVVLGNGSGVKATNFRMFVTVTSFNSHYYYTVSVSPNDNTIFENNFALMTALASGTNYTGINERLVSTTDDFIGRSATSNQADFLFMIDDSGSMGDQQEALSAAAGDFDTAITLSGMNYNIAILTTSAGADDVPCTENCYDRVIKDVGIISDINIFKTQVSSVETNGSGVETGIYNSEQALKSISNGDSSNGLLNTAPLSFPRADTQLSLIILSDEVSQYENRAGTTFNVNSNLFIRDNILVNSIIDTGLCGDGQEKTGQFDDLSIATGGLVGNICNGGANPNFSAVMQSIVFQAAGAYHLTYNYAKPNSIKVSVDGVKISPSIKNGYMYIEGTNSIAFFGTLPKESSTIEIYYEYPKDINLFAND